MAGLLFLITIVTGVFAQMFVSGRLVVNGDAAATANNIVAHADLYRWGFTIYMIEMVCNVAMTALFYELLEPVSKSASLLSAFVGLVGCAIKSMSRVFYMAPLFVLGGASYLTVFNPQQKQALALFCLRINDQGAAVGLIFFGFYALLQGYLVLRSTFLPRFLGMLSIIGGIGWLAFLWPSLGNRFFPLIALVGLVGSAVKIFWLLVFGVNEERWYEQAAGSELLRGQFSVAAAEELA
jgi:hypothetical protein